MILLDDIEERMELVGSFIGVKYNGMGTGRKPRLIFEHFTCVKNSDANGAYARTIAINKLPITHR